MNKIGVNELQSKSIEIFLQHSSRLPVEAAYKIGMCLINVHIFHVAHGNLSKVLERYHLYFIIYVNKVYY